MARRFRPIVVQLLSPKTGRVQILGWHALGALDHTRSLSARVRPASAVAQHKNVYRRVSVSTGVTSTSGDIQVSTGSAVMTGTALDCATVLVPLVTLLYLMTSTQPN